MNTSKTLQTRIKEKKAGRSVVLHRDSITLVRSDINHTMLPMVQSWAISSSQNSQHLNQDSRRSWMTYELKSWDIVAARNSIMRTTLRFLHTFPCMPQVKITMILFNTQKI